MSFRDVDKSDPSTRLIEKRLILAVLIVSVLGIGFAFWFFLDVYDDFNDANNILPLDCYSLNGKQICPKR
jgi:hypothetical protein